ncbi:phage holin [Natribacillus halophilus]|uniref:Holin, SPP1 family n=1 Tax=Natribacillus halophilus TaxID=549003 RepID=A0A1G8RT40_9BACI|nr:phage holin [Natribacillus halophilus]SDJ19645.1 holin, SPP1 family [Natribacillus halophilus]
MDKGTIVRTIVLAVALINQILVSTGLNPIPGTEEQWGEILTAAFTFVTGAVAWFKNNYITATGKEQKEVLKERNLTKAK